MAKKKRSKKSKPTRLPRGPLLRAAAYLVLAALLAGAGYVGATTAWGAIASSPRFRLDLQAFSLSGGPSWVKAPAMSRELRQQLEGLPKGASIFDRDLTAAVYQQAQRLPLPAAGAGRRAAAAQHAQHRGVLPQAGRRRGLERHGYMVDQDGVPLPESLFNPLPEWRAQPMPVITDRLLTQPPPAGRAWDWPRMAVGARFCEYLLQSGLLARLPIATIDVTGVGREASGTPDMPAIVLTTTGGAQVKWGASSVYADVGLEEPAFLIPDEEKLQTLLGRLALYPNLQGIQYVDLRFHGKVYFLPSK